MKYGVWKFPGGRHIPITNKRQLIKSVPYKNSVKRVINRDLNDQVDAFCVILSVLYRMLRRLFDGKNKHEQTRCLFVFVAKTAINIAAGAAEPLQLHSPCSCESAHIILYSEIRPGAKLRFSN